MPPIATLGFPAHFKNNKNNKNNNSTVRSYHTDLPTDVIRSFAHAAHRISPSFDSTNLITETHRHVRTPSAGNGMQVQEDGGLRPDVGAYNGNGIVGADALKGKKRKKDDVAKEGKDDADAGHTNGAGANTKGNGTEHEENESKKQKGKRKLVFVDPDEPAAKWWWPGMVGPSFLFDVVLQAIQRFTFCLLYCRS